jgi:hypothetical protein
LCTWWKPAAHRGVLVFTAGAGVWCWAVSEKEVQGTRQVVYRRDAGCMCAGGGAGGQCMQVCRCRGAGGHLLHMHLLVLHTCTLHPSSTPA